MTDLTDATDAALAAERAEADRRYSIEAALYRDAEQNVSDLTDENAQLRGQIDELKAQLDAVLHPDPLVGISFPVTPRAVDAAYEARAGVARIFLQGLKGQVWGNIVRVQRATKAKITTYVVSYTEQDEDLVRAFAATIPDGITVYLAFKHEPEDDMTSALWKQIWAKHSPVIRAAGFIATQILMAWTVDPASGRNFLRDWFLGALVDAVLWDAYIDKASPATQVDHIVTAMKACGIKLTGIAETGSVVGDAQRAAKIVDLMERVTAVNALGDVRFVVVCWWNQKMPDTTKTVDGKPVTVKGADFRLDDATADAHYAAA